MTEDDRSTSDCFDLENKNVVITGASSGLGHHFAGVLSRAGAKVILGARRQDNLAIEILKIAK